MVGGSVAGGVVGGSVVAGAEFGLVVVLSLEPAVLTVDPAVDEVDRVDEFAMSIEEHEALTSPAAASTATTKRRRNRLAERAAVGIMLPQGIVDCVGRWLCGCMVDPFRAVDTGRLRP